MTTYAAPFLCIYCKHIDAGAVDGGVLGIICNAYPEGVPDAILSNQVDHRKPLVGDNGIRFEGNEDDPIDADLLRKLDSLE